ncbi:hypothetical protein ACFQBQ_13560 [Granulicella cerasi]|uniref:Lipoprotein n=1 Tax=Granulicella cerasi TaxID=741063 RepID=A0ABW1ZBS2_9BACT|nr:hypothetical protein [Granulicella cerasi]
MLAQQYSNASATDSAAQASPTTAPKVLPAATDASAPASPALGAMPSLGNGMSFPAGTSFHVKLLKPVDSGSLKNGQDVPAKLSMMVRAKNGTALAAGTPVMLNVVGTVPAGKINAVGELSLTVVRVGKTDVVTETKTFRGKPGSREVGDANPALGTNAGMPAGAELTFRTAGTAVAANEKPSANGVTPGSVDGVAVGSQPATGPKSNSGQPTYGAPTEQH